MTPAQHLAPLNETARNTAAMMPNAHPAGTVTTTREHNPTPHVQIAILAQHLAPFSETATTTAVPNPHPTDDVTTGHERNRTSPVQVATSDQRFLVFNSSASTAAWLMSRAFVAVSSVSGPFAASARRSARASAAGPGSESSAW